MIKTNQKDLRPARIKLMQEIKLLSGGYADRKAFPGGMIRVYPWDSDVDAWAAERSLRGPRGTLLWDLCERVCDLNGCPIDKFVLGDVTTVLLCSRAITATNNNVLYSAKCPHCSNMNSGEIKVPAELERLGEKGEDYPGYDEIVLPDVGDKVKIRPLIVGDMHVIDGRPESAKKKVSDRICRLLAPIVSINDTTPDAIDELVSWYDALLPIDKKFYSDQQDLLYPHLNTELDYVCDSCTEPFKFQLTFNENFFRGGGLGKS